VNKPTDEALQSCSRKKWVMAWSKVNAHDLTQSANILPQEESKVPVSESILRKFCHKERPQWDSFGHLSTYGGGKQRTQRSLADRFGSDIWQRLQGKRVLDFGCGYGADVIALATLGISAVGIENRQLLVDGACARAAQLNVPAHFYHTSAQLPGDSFDTILSINSFEHYLDPAGVLDRMRNLLRPGGDVLIDFSPPWLHPYGAHCREMTAFPWVQVFFPEKAVMKLRSEYYAEKPTCYEEAAGGLGKMTVSKFNRVIADSPFKFRKLELIGIKGLQAPTKIPVVRELVTSSIRAELEAK
jgi:SAM-dependent methyltransferase